MFFDFMIFYSNIYTEKIKNYGKNEESFINFNVCLYFLEDNKFPCVLHISRHIYSKVFMNLLEFYYQLKHSHFDKVIIYVHDCMNGDLSTFLFTNKYYILLGSIFRSVIRYLLSTSI